MNKASKQYTEKKFLDKYLKGLGGNYEVAYPAILKELEKIRNKKVLDLGCGAGDFAKLLYARGAKVTAADFSKKWVETCKFASKGKFDCVYADAGNMKNFKSKSFDFVTMNMVFLNITPKVRVERAFKEVARVLKNNGSLVFTDLHSVTMFIDTIFEKQAFDKTFSYFQNGATFKSHVPLGDGSTITFTDIHWTIEFYTEALRKAGLVIHRLVEPQPVSKALRKKYSAPEFMVFHCKKRSTK